MKHDIRTREVLRVLEMASVGYSAGEIASMTKDCGVVNGEVWRSDTWPMPETGVRRRLKKLEKEGVVESYSGGRGLLWRLKRTA